METFTVYIQAAALALAGIYSGISAREKYPAWWKIIMSAGIAAFLLVMAWHRVSALF